MLFVILHPGQWHILAGTERWQVADLRFLAQVWGCCLDTSSRAGSTSSTRSGRTTSCWTSGGPGQTATTWPGRGFTKCSKILSPYRQIAHPRTNHCSYLHTLSISMRVIIFGLRIPLGFVNPRPGPWGSTTKGDITFIIDYWFKYFWLPMKS